MTNDYKKALLVTTANDELTFSGLDMGVALQDMDTMAKKYYEALRADGLWRCWAKWVVGLHDYMAIVIQDIQTISPSNAVDFYNARIRAYVNYHPEPKLENPAVVATKPGQVAAEILATAVKAEKLIAGNEARSGTPYYRIGREVHQGACPVLSPNVEKK